MKPASLEECRSLCSEGTFHSARRVHFTPLGGYTSLRSEGVTRPARSVLLALLGACYSPRPKRVSRPARSVLLAPPEACYSPCSERVSRPARSTPQKMLFHQVFRQGKLEANRKQNYIYKTKFYCPPCSEGTSRKAETKTADLSPCKTCFIYDEKISFMSGTVIPKVIMYASTIKSEKYFRNIRDKSRAGIGVYFVEYGVNFRLRKCHYCKSRF